MANEKRYTAKEVATFVLSKVGQILKKSELSKGVLKLQTDPEEGIKGVHSSFGDEGKSLAGANVRAAQTASSEDKAKKFSDKAVKEHEEKLKELKEMPNPNLTRTEEMEKAEKEAEDRYYVDTKKRDDHGRVTIYDKKRDIEFKAKLKEESDMEKKEKCEKCGDMHELEKKDRCWAGYEPTPGKKPYEKGSCKSIEKSEELQKEEEPEDEWGF